ncbi:MAG: hypothetical protein KKA84_01910 [Bacteroidetes bacterium]|nr:hypothetical protein [Bacteroidota bacterium]
MKISFLFILFFSTTALFYSQNDISIVEHETVRFEPLSYNDNSYNIYITAPSISIATIDEINRNYNYYSKSYLDENTKVFSELKLVNDSTIMFFTKDIDDFFVCYDRFKPKDFGDWYDLELSTNKSNEYDNDLYKCVLKWVPPPYISKPIELKHDTKLLIRTIPQDLDCNTDNLLFLSSLIYDNAEFTISVSDTMVHHSCQDTDSLFVDNFDYKTTVRYSKNKSGVIEKNYRSIHCDCCNKFSIKIYDGNKWIWERNNNVGDARIVVHDFDKDDIDEIVVISGLCHGPHPIWVYKSKYSAGL